MSGQHCESHDVKRETVHCYPVNSSLLTAVARNAWNLSAVFNLNVSLDFVSGNIEILGKQNSLFPSGPVIKCLLYLLVSTRAVIGQFSGPYSPVRPAKI